MNREQLERNRQVAENMRRSRLELGRAAIATAHKGAIGPDDAKALNYHLGVNETGLILSHAKRSKKDRYLANIAEAIQFRRFHLQTNRIVRVETRLTETSVLAAAVGESHDEPLGRRELVELPVVRALAEHHSVDPNFAVDQTVMRDLQWLWAPTASRR